MEIFSTSCGKLCISVKNMSIEPFFLMIYSSEFVEDLCISSFVLEYEYEN